jgi:hypothetical protein
MTSHGIRRIERLNYVFGGLAIIIAALTVSERPALGVAIGVVLTCLNFAALRWLVFKWTAAVKSGDSSGSGKFVLIIPKMVGMMGLVAVAVIFLPIDAIGFLIGYSIFLPSIVVGAVLDTVSPGPADPEPAGDEPPPSSPPSETHG